jgi:hypothetical protein
MDSSTYDTGFKLSMDPSTPQPLKNILNTMHTEKFLELKKREIKHMSENKFLLK